MGIFPVLMVGVFTIINIRIIWSDIGEKKIPNQYLTWLVILATIAWTYRAILTGNIEIGLGGILEGIIALLISFGLYYYGLWSAGDAKYLLILSFFLPSFSLVPFIGNIAILTIVHMGLYYIWFYGWFAFRDSTHRLSFIKNIWKTQWDALSTFLQHPKTKQSKIRGATYRIFKFLLFFLVIFVSMRLVRQYLMEDLWSIAWVMGIFEHYPAYAIAWLWGILFGVFAMIRRFLNAAKTHLTYFFWRRNRPVDIGLVFSAVLFCILITFICYEYIRDAADIQRKLFLILTLYLVLYLIFRWLYYSYVFLFHLNEQDMVSIQQLKSGDIVDKSYLIKLFWHQSVLGAFGNPGMLSPRPQEYFESIENPIDRKTAEKLQKIYQIVNEHHITQNTSNFQKITTIKILKTFPFAIYIFLGFCITYTWWDGALRTMIHLCIEILRRIYW